LGNYVTATAPTVRQGLIWDQPNLFAAFELNETANNSPVGQATGMNVQAVAGVGTGWAIGSYSGAQSGPGLDQTWNVLSGTESSGSALGTGLAYFVYGMRNYATVESGGAHNIIGGAHSVQASNVGVVVTTAMGCQSNPVAFDGGNITNCYCYFAADAQLWGGGTITNFAGITCLDLAGATNNTNVLFGTSTIPAGNWNQYNASTKPNYFAGPIDLNSSLQLPTNATAINYTVLDTDGYLTILGTGGAGGIQVTLPLAANNPGRVLVVKKVDVGVGVVTVAPQGPDIVDGLPLQPLPAQWNSIMVQSDGGTNWFIIA
jgi:hypothetical protein